MEVLVEPVVSFIVEKLGDKLIDEAILFTGLLDEVRWIEQELQLMQSLLKDAEAKKQGDQRVKNWVQDVRSLAYDIEDVIDTFLLRIEPRRRPGLIVSLASIVSSFMASCEMGWKFIFIKHKIREISERSTNYDLQRIHPGEGTSNNVSRSIQEWKLPSPNVHEEPDFVGFHEEFEALVAQLTDKGGTRRVVSLVGTGGLGKTTLARKVYNDERVQKYFHLQAWISVTQEFALRDILQVIIKRWSVLPDTLMEKMDDAELTYFIAKYPKAKRYLVVLDDIWEPQAWDALKNVFPDSNNGSRVMLTTRIKDIVSDEDERSRKYELRSLNDEESWSLFCKKTFHEQNGICPQELQHLGKEIVDKCEGLPLAIIAIGGLLSKKEDISEWEYVSKNIINIHLVKGTSDILSLSYQDLPYFLKPCFLYLVNFPKDHEFRAKELIQMWAAEGLFQQRPGLTVEEFGEGCLMELIQRSMVQVAKRSSRGSIKSVYMQKNFRVLSILEAKEYGFLEVHSENANAPSTARRLAIHHNDLSEYNSLSRSTPFLRSVFIYTQGRKLLQRKQEKFLYRGFKLLKVLCLNGAYIKKLPNAIGELFHLRYLGCKGTSLETLPSSMGNLPHLQTLFVSSFHDMKVPGTILEMQELRHLQVEDAVKSTYLGWKESWRVIEGHPGLDSESNLQTLTCVEAGEWMVDCLGKLINLRKLGIRLHHDRAYDQVLYESIPKMKCLQSLSVVTRCPFSLSVPPLLQIPNLSKFRLEGKLEMLPESTEFPITLTKLTLAFSYLKEDPLPTLAKLENLRVLRLLGASYTGKKMACVANGFRRLESLHLEALDKLEDWSIAKGAMPRLSHLRIDDCQNLNMPPEGLQHVTTLRKVELWNMRDKGEGMDWHKIRHEHTIDFDKGRHSKHRHFLSS